MSLNALDKAIDLYAECALYKPVATFLAPIIDASSLAPPSSSPWES